MILDPEKRKRNRTFIDPVSEVPRLEEWFILNTHPSHALIARYTEELNRLPYRQKVHFLVNSDLLLFKLSGFHMYSVFTQLYFRFETN